jgi:hypothetical protein
MSDPHHKGDADSCSSIDVKSEWDADSWVDVKIVEVSHYMHYQDPMSGGVFRTWYPNGQLASEYEQKSGLISSRPGRGRPLSVPRIKRAR